MVLRILRRHPDWTMQRILDTWPRRGLDTIQTATADERALISSAVVRCHPDDRTNGFFVSLFEKRAQSK